MLNSGCIMTDMMMKLLIFLLTQVKLTLKVVKMDSTGHPCFYLVTFQINTFSTYSS